jgi:amidase
MSVPPTSALTETGIPAACTGIFTLRPSHGRFTTQRCRSGLAGQEAVKSVNGPMAKALEDITMYSKAVIDAKPWLVDPTMLPIPWQPVEPKQKLKIAVMWNDGICRPTPPVARALKETVQKLESVGHEVVDWDPKEFHLKALQLLVSDSRIVKYGRTHHCLGPNVCSRRRQKRSSTTGTYQ